MKYKITKYLVTCKSARRSTKFDVTDKDSSEIARSAPRKDVYF